MAPVADAALRLHVAILVVILMVVLVADRGFRPSGCRFRGAFGVTPVADWALRFRMAILAVILEVTFVCPLSQMRLLRSKLS